MIFWTWRSYFIRWQIFENKVWCPVSKKRTKYFHFLLSLAYPIDRLDWALFSVVILFHHLFPLLDKVEIRAFILPRNFSVVLIIFTGRGGAGNPPLPTARGVHPWFIDLRRRVFKKIQNNKYKDKQLKLPRVGFTSCLKDTWFRVFECLNTATNIDTHEKWYQYVCKYIHMNKHKSANTKTITKLLVSVLEVNSKTCAWESRSNFSYDTVSDVAEMLVQFASKTLTPCKMH